MSEGRRPVRDLGKPERVVVTGLAVLSPLGCTLERFWHGITSGAIGTRPVTRFSTVQYSADDGGEVAGFDAEMLPAGADSGDPLSLQYGLAASAMALEDSGLDRTEDVGLYLGTVMGTRPRLERLLHQGRCALEEPTWLSPSSMVRTPAHRLGLGGPLAVWSTGCSAGNDAIGAAAGLIAEGRATCMLAGGAEELSESVFALFTSLRALAPDVVRPFDAQRKGILPSEGAAVLVLEALTHARARGARTYGEVLGYAASADAYHLTAPRPDGDGLVTTLQQALDQGGLAPSDIEYVSAHGTGTPSNDAVEARAIERVFGDRATPAVSSIKGALGHAQGTASAFEAVACLLAIRHSLVPGMPTLRQPDPACEVVDLVRGASRALEVRRCASLAQAFGGSVSTLILGAVDDPGVDR